jgi:hypothetical protein
VTPALRLAAGAPRTRTKPWAVLALLLGLLAMHGLASTHAGMPQTHVGMAQAPTAQHAHGPMLAVEAMSQRPAASAAPAVGSSGMRGLCVAVLTTAGLLLAALIGRRAGGREPGCGAPALPVPDTTAVPRPPPDLHRLGVSRT